MSNKFASIEVNRSKSDINQGKQASIIKILIDNFIYASISFIFSCVWFYQIASALHINEPAFYLWPLRIFILLYFILLTKFPKVVGALSVGIILITLLFGVVIPSVDVLTSFYTNVFSQLKETLNWMLSPINILPTGFSDALAIVSIIVSAIMIYIKPMPVLLSVFWIIPFVVTVRNNISDISLIVIFIGLGCIAVTFARQSSFQFSWRKSWQLPPVILIVFLLGSVFAMQSVLPSNLFFNTKLNRYLDQGIKSNQKMPDTVRYYEFSIRDAGFYPQDSHLGGPIEKTNEPFMKFYGPSEPLYLRGTVFNQFDKNIWYASLMDENYLFYNEAPIKQQLEAFSNKEIVTVDETVFNQYFMDSVISIQPIYSPVQAIFHGGKPEKIINHDLETKSIEDESTNDSGLYLNQSVDAIKYYFNPSGQIYASEPVSADGYSVVGQVSNITTNDQILLNLQKDTYEETIHFAEQTLRNNGTYKAIIEDLDPGLAKIVYDDEMDAAIKLKSIIEYLQNNYNYNLNVPNIESSQDLLVEFLKTKEGYCTYFATALTVLTREAGFESRYVEGFIVQGVNSTHSVDDYEREVTSDQAHAWTEIKIDELGWLPFDATPGTALSGIYTDEEKEAELNQEQNETTQTTQPTTTPTTTQQNQSQTTETKPSEINEQVKGKVIGGIVLRILIVLLLIIGIILYILWRKRYLQNIHNLEWLQNRFNADNRFISAMVWKDIKSIYQINQESFEQSDTVLLALRKIIQKINVNPKIRDKAYQALENSFYAEKEPNQEQMTALMDLYYLIEKNVKDNTPKIRWFFARFLTANLNKK